MNQINLIGRTTKELEASVTVTGKPYVLFNLAIPRGKDKDGNDRGTDFPRIIAYGRTAELLEKYVSKGDLVGITGKITTSSYEMDGKKVYSTEVTAESITLIGSKRAEAIKEPDKPVDTIQVEGFSALDEQIPF